MLIHIHVASGKDREEGLAESLAPGLRAHGDWIKVSHTADFNEPDVDAAVGAVFGLKGASRRIMDAYRAAGKHTIMFDKALIRVPGAAFKHLRVCIDGDTPHRYLMRQLRSFERWERLRIPIVARRKSSGRDAIILALSSQKYCDYHGLGDATEYAVGLVAALRLETKKRPIIYRPKPSWHDFQAVPGTILSRPPEFLEGMLPGAHMLVTHGSSAAVDAIIAGVPAITLGRCAASPVAMADISGPTINDPYFPGDEARYQWLCQLAFCQWSVSELQSGEAWGFIRSEIEAISK